MDQAELSSTSGVEARLDLRVSEFGRTPKDETRETIGTVTPQIHLRRRGDLLAVAVGHVLVVVDVSAAPRELSRLVFRDRGTLQVTGLAFGP